MEECVPDEKQSRDGIEELFKDASQWKDCAVVVIFYVRYDRQYFLNALVPFDLKYKNTLECL
jgi:hypothetical protein